MPFCSGLKQANFTTYFLLQEAFVNLECNEVFMMLQVTLKNK